MTRGPVKTLGVLRALALVILTLLAVGGRDSAVGVERGTDDPACSRTPVDSAMNATVKVERAARSTFTGNHLDQPPPPCAEPAAQSHQRRAASLVGLGLDPVGRRSPTVLSLHRPRARSSLEPPSA